MIKGFAEYFCVAFLVILSTLGDTTGLVAEISDLQRWMGDLFIATLAAVALLLFRTLNELQKHPLHEWIAAFLISVWAGTFLGHYTHVWLGMEGMQGLPVIFWALAFQGIAQVFINNEGLAQEYVRRVLDRLVSLLPGGGK